MKNSPLHLPLYACLLLIAACGKDAEVVVYDDQALADESQTANWLAYGRTHNERRFSPSEQINTGNVANLKVDWFLDLPNDVGLVSTPLVVDGTLYFTGTMNVIRAVDAVTGELLWEYDYAGGRAERRVDVRGQARGAPCHRARSGSDRGLGVRPDQAERHVMEYRQGDGGRGSLGGTGRDGRK